MRRLVDWVKNNVKIFLKACKVLFVNPNRTETQYWVRTGRGMWKQVTKEEFVEAKRRAGLRAEHVEGVDGFLADGISGKVTRRVIQQDIQGDPVSSEQKKIG